jgi:hypothetical protein
MIPALIGKMSVTDTHLWVSFRPIHTALSASNRSVSFVSEICAALKLSGDTASIGTQHHDMQYVTPKLVLPFAVGSWNLSRDGPAGDVPLSTLLSQPRCRCTLKCMPYPFQDIPAAGVGTRCRAELRTAESSAIGLRHRHGRRRRAHALVMSQLSSVRAVAVVLLSFRLSR